MYQQLSLPQAEKPAVFQRLVQHSGYACPNTCMYTKVSAQLCIPHASPPTTVRAGHIHTAEQVDQVTLTDLVGISAQANSSEIP